MNAPETITFDAYLVTKGIFVAKLNKNELAFWRAAYEAEVPTEKRASSVPDKLHGVPELGIQAESVPTSLMISGASAEFKLIEAEAGDGKPRLKKFSIVGYTGGILRLENWPYPVVVDLEGMNIPRQQIPALMGHNRTAIVGHTESIDKTAQRLKLAGVLSGHSDTEKTASANASREIVRLAGNGFEWQASIGASPDKVQYVPEGESIKLNGRNFSGPLYAILKSTLAEISFVAIGADMATSAAVAAGAKDTHKELPMNEFDKWLTSKGFDLANISPQIKASMQAIFDVEAKAANDVKAAAEKAAKKPDHPAIAPDQSFDQKMAAIEAENQRIVYIRERTTSVAEKYIGDPEKLKDLRELCASAIEDKKVDARAYDLALLRLDRALAPQVFAPAQQAINADVIAAAICVTHKLPGVEKNYDDRTLQAAHSKFPRGIGLKELLVIAAERNNNYRGSSRDDAALCRAAFGSGYGGIQAEGPSTMSLPNIFSNVANKFLAAGFYYTEQTWREIADIKTANDFKQMSTYRLTGNNKFKLVPPGGEIKHGTLSELAYTNVVDTYGIMIGLDRRDVRNDSLNALTKLPQELGRGAGDSLNEIFWTEWLDDSTFFPTDGSLGNYDAGATDSVLSLAGLANADSIFSLLTKPDGSPLGAMAKTLLVPRTLRATAMNLMNGQFLTSALTTPTGTTVNVWNGMFNIASSAYLSSSAIPGYSATAWYLLCDPQNIAAIEVAFLDGIESPHVETSEFDFDRLGLSMRAYLDWGVNKQEPRGAIKLKGAA